MADFSFRRVLKGHHGEVTAVAFSTDDQLLVSGSADQTIRVWDVSHESWEALRKAREDQIQAERLDRAERRRATARFQKDNSRWARGAAQVSSEYYMNLLRIGLVGLGALWLVLECVFHVHRLRTNPERRPEICPWGITAAMLTAGCLLALDQFVHLSPEDLTGKLIGGALLGGFGAGIGYRLGNACKWICQW